LTAKSTAADRWRDAHRTNPDYVVFIPSDDDTPIHDVGPRPDGPWDNGNTHFIVTVTTTGAFFATWTQACDAFHGLDARVVTARSLDQGRSWSRPTVVEAPPDDSGKTSVWSFPVVVPHSGRIWLFHHRNTGPVDFDRGMTGVLSWRVSDDDGVTWGKRHDTEIGRGAIDDPNMLSSWVPSGWQVPLVNKRGEVICPMTRWASNAHQSQFEKVTSEIGFNLRHHEGWFLRFDNVLTVDDPADLIVTTWPDGDHGIQVPHPRNERLSSAMEPSIQNLSDGRIVAVMRTMTGHIWYSVSADFGESWSPAETLRFQPGGPPIPHPSAPCPLHKLRDGRFLLFFHNNDGTAHGADGPGDGRARRPVCVSVGREIDNPGGQPLVFSRPHVLADNEYAVTAVTGKTGGMPIYGSFTEVGDERVLWYPDNTTYLLGRQIPDHVLEDAWIPS
jgi:hypothetical protein